MTLKSTFPALTKQQFEDTIEQLEQLAAYCNQATFTEAKKARHGKLLGAAYQALADEAKKLKDSLDLSSPDAYIVLCYCVGVLKIMPVYNTRIMVPAWEIRDELKIQLDEYCSSNKKLKLFIAAIAVVIAIATITTALTLGFALPIVVAMIATSAVLVIAAAAITFYKKAHTLSHFAEKAHHLFYKQKEVFLPDIVSKPDYSGFNDDFPITEVKNTEKFDSIRMKMIFKP